MRFKTANAEYGEQWRSAGAPTFSQVNTNHALLRQLRSELARECGETRAKLASAPSAPPRTRPFEPSVYKVPEPLLQSRSPLYSTSSSDYGRLAPTKAELPFRYAPKKSSFPAIAPPASRNGLNTTVTRSRINDVLDYYY